MRRDPCHRECLHWTGGRTASSCYPTVRGYLLLPGMRFSYGVSIPKVRREAEECASTFDFQGDALIATLCSWHRNSGGWSAIRGVIPPFSQDQYPQVGIQVVISKQSEPSTN